MKNNLINHIRKYVDLKEEHIPVLLSHCKKLQFRRKENLLHAGQTCRSLYFVDKGCLRLFYINEKGIEQTTQFAIENWWMTDYTSLRTTKPSQFFIQAVEKTEVFSLDVQAQENLFTDLPIMERYFRLVSERAYAAALMRVKLLYEYSREELYHHFTTHYPEFVQRVPQYLIASFLGFTPEYLSEIRRRAIS